MNVYEHLVRPELSGDLKKDVYAFLTENGHRETAEHCMKVGEQARELAVRYGADPETAARSGYLHDISAVFPNDARISVSVQLGIEVLPEEESFPMIIHQKLSKAIARDLFGVEDPEILSAVECHTTLKKQASQMDKLLFTADKVAWDQIGTPPYLEELNRGLALSIDHAAFAYIRYLWSRKDTLRVVHPWLKEAYADLSRHIESESQTCGT
ncbi:HDIG domain-containing protein [Paenibacillus chitinolyticus]|uniref:Bis(5'-nucleosyl)-tetraphosphatase (Symmetrical) YqeK n=1 Tax=Paenibacillus chitinolyticus TaxID=79263 RepID=A0A410WZ82_9BACL|nr:bis(5'-nucleosyl)-tetraphosphatase (symmetrical) YqeK [Paenibacillus chitinolyticus]MCY9590222.1 bis(5'-nucleosyl)-tetraphosphatase (symmetrical) YqeK [Paenibacillus chitinolyticus]MCY9596918.1 bis(5'-nucleosyl)-tetraphosphatase (symmetrical) YqeK [Paenibacillus chitinolyticus]QAV19769.1 HDIG domain-containing protein [Paenibacillus chitinolyticus]